MVLPSNKNPSQKNTRNDSVDDDVDGKGQKCGCHDRDYDDDYVFQGIINEQVQTKFEFYQNLEQDSNYIFNGILQNVSNITESVTIYFKGWSIGKTTVTLSPNERIRIKNLPAEKLVIYGKSPLNNNTQLKITGAVVEVKKGNYDEWTLEKSESSLIPLPTSLPLTVPYAGTIYIRGRNSNAAASTLSITINNTASVFNNGTAIASGAFFEESFHVYSGDIINSVNLTVNGIFLKSDY